MNSTNDEAESPEPDSTPWQTGRLYPEMTPEERCALIRDAMRVYRATEQQPDSGTHRTDDSMRD